MKPVQTHYPRTALVAADFESVGVGQGVHRCTNFQHLAGERDSLADVVGQLGAIDARVAVLDHGDEAGKGAGRIMRRRVKNREDKAFVAEFARVTPVQIPMRLMVD